MQAVGHTPWGVCVRLAHAGPLLHAAGAGPRSPHTARALQHSARKTSRAVPTQGCRSTCCAARPRSWPRAAMQRSNPSPSPCQPHNACTRHPNPILGSPPHPRPRGPPVPGSASGTPARTCHRQRSPACRPPRCPRCRNPRHSPRRRPAARPSAPCRQQPGGEGVSEGGQLAAHAAAHLCLQRQRYGPRAREEAKTRQQRQLPAL